MKELLVVLVEELALVQVKEVWVYFLVEEMVMSSLWGVVPYVQ